METAKLHTAAVLEISKAGSLSGAPSFFEGKIRLTEARWSTTKRALQPVLQKEFLKAKDYQRVIRVLASTEKILPGECAIFDLFNDIYWENSPCSMILAEIKKTASWWMQGHNVFKGFQQSSLKDRGTGRTIFL